MGDRDTASRYSGRNELQSQRSVEDWTWCDRWRPHAESAGKRQGVDGILVTCKRGGGTRAQEGIRLSKGRGMWITESGDREGRGKYTASLCTSSGAKECVLHWRGGGGRSE